MLALLFLVFSLLKGFFMFLLPQKMIIVVSRLIEYDLKNTVFDHYQRLDSRLLQTQQHRRPDEPHQRGRRQGAHVSGPAVMYTINLVVLFARASRACCM